MSVQTCVPIRTSVYLSIPHAGENSELNISKGWKVHKGTQGTHLYVLQGLGRSL